MIQRASRYYFGNSPNERAIFDLDFAGLGLAGHRIEVYGGSLAEEVYVGHGFTIDLTNLAGGRDLIYLKGASSDYTYANSGTVVTLTHTHIPGTVITFSAASLNQDLVLFTDGFVAASDFASAGIKPPGTPIPPVDSSRKSSSNPADLPAPTVGGSLRAESLDNNGANFSPVSPGTQLRVLGKDGVEQVYVGPGTIVDADELGQAQDLIYLTGNRTDYTFSASGGVLTLVRKTRFQGFEEKVFVTGGDKLIFRDGSVGTTDVINHLNTPGSSFPPLNPNEKTPLVTITEALNAIRGAAEANTADSAPIDAATYLAAGVTGIGGTDQPPVSAINSALNSGVMGALPAADGISGQEADETADVQAIVNAYTRILNKANDTADSPGNNQNDSSITVLVDDYVKIGASIGDATLSTPAGGNRLALLNDIVGGKRRVDVDTIGEINTLAGIANAIQTIAAGGSVSSKVTVANLGAIGLDTTGLVDGQNMDKLLADIATKNDNGSDTNSLAKLQAMINALDKTAPTISSVALSSATDALNGILNAGDVVSATVTFSEAVNVTGTPILKLAIGSSLVDATYSSGSGSTALVFRYTIKATDNDITGIAIPANALSLGDGSIRDAGLNNAVLTSAAVADNTGYRVDTTAPTAIDLEAGTDGIQASQGQFYGRANAGSGKTLFPNLASFNGNSNSDIAQIEVSVGGTGLDTTNDKLVASAVTINLNTTGSGNNVAIGSVQGVSWSLSAGRVLTLSRSNGGVFTEAQVIAIDKALQLRTTLTATQGDRTFTITHIDSAGNRAEPAVGTMTVDTIAPTQTVGSVSFSDDTGSSATDRITSTAVQTISGTLSAALGTNDLLFASVNGGITWTNITDKVSGTSITWDNATLSSGSLRFKVEDRAGNTSSTSSFFYTLDTVAPNPPSLTLGAGVSDGATSAEARAGTGVVTVNAENGSSVVVIFTNGNATVTKTITGSGSAAAATLANADLTTLGDGTINVSAVATDAAGNVSTAGTTSFVLDTVAPNLVVTQTNTTIAGDGVINNAERDAGVVLSGTTEAGRPVTITTGTGTSVSVTANNSGAWSATVPAANLPIGGSGIVTFTVTSTDAAGNLSTVTRTANVDTVAPTAYGLAITNLVDDTGSSRNVASGGAGNDSTPTVQGTLGTSAQGANLAADERLVVYRGMDMTGATSLTPNGVSNGQIPNGYRQVTFTTADGNWAQNIFLPTAPEIGDVVQMSRVSQIHTNLYQGNRLIKAFFKPHQAVHQWGNETDQYVWNGTDWISALSQVGVATITPVVGGQSTWSLTDQGAWADNETRSYIARLEDTAGNVLGGTLGYVYRYDITAPNLVVTQTNTTIAGDGVINNAERSAGVVLSGTTEAGLPVTIATSIGANLTVTANNSGAWSATVPAANLPTVGSVTFTVTSSDLAGNPSTVTRAASVDTDGPGPSGAQIDLVRTVLDNSPNLTYSYGSGSFYRLVSAEQTWEAANAFAASASFFGQSGHLVHVNSAAENSYAKGVNLYNGGKGWMGGSDKAVEGTWRWYYGDIAGETFFTAGSQTPGTYTNWTTGRPDNYQQLQHFTSYWDEGVSVWDDLENSYPLRSLIEWEGSKVLNVQAYNNSKSIRVNGVESGKAYLVNAANTVTSASDITSLSTAQWNMVDLTAPSINLLSYEDFENSTAGWTLSSNGSAISGPTVGGVHKFLGRPSGAAAGQDKITKTYNLGIQNANKTVTIDFDLYEMDTWDGELFQVFVNGVATSVQSYRLAASSIRDGGVNMGNWSSGNVSPEEKHHYTLQATLNSAGSFTLGFGSLLDQGLADESWGIDNLTITTANGAGSVSLSLEGLANGQYKLYTADSAGNLSAPATDVITVDNTAPNAPVLALGAGVSDGATTAEATAGTGVVTVNAESGSSVAVIFTRGNLTVTKAVAGTGQPAAVTLTPDEVSRLGDGQIQVSAVATDPAGNTSTAGSSSFNLDTTVLSLSGSRVMSQANVGSFKLIPGSNADRLSVGTTSNSENHPSAFNSRKMTIQAWINTTNQDGNYHMIVCKAGAFGLYVKDGKLGFFDFHQNGGPRDTGYRVAGQGWINVAFQFVERNPGYDSTSDVFVNGTRIYTQENGFTQWNWGQNLTIGGRSDVNQSFDGQIDGVRIWGDKISEAALRESMSTQVLAQNSALRTNLWADIQFENTFADAALNQTVTKTADPFSKPQLVTSIDRPLSPLDSIQVTLNEAGTMYLVNKKVHPMYYAKFVEDITNASDDNWNSVVVQGNTPTAMSLATLSDGSYDLYAADSAGNLKMVQASAATIRTAPRDPELIVNGGFDNWSAWGANRAYWVGAKQGYSSAVILGAGSDEPSLNSSYWQSISTVPGSSYVVSFDVGYSTGNAMHADGDVPAIVRAHAINLDQIESLPSLALIVSTKTAAYTRYSYEFVATGSSTKIGFTSGPQRSGTDVFLDNVSVKPGSLTPVDQPVGTELIVNGGFDEWSGWFSQNAYHDGAKQGYSSAVILGANSSEPNYNSQYGQTINTVIGATYTVSFKIGYSTGYAQHGNAAGTAAISVLSTASDVNNTVLQTLTASTSTAAYSTHSYEFVATSRVTQIGFASGPQPNGTDVYLDDVSVKRKAVAPVVIDLNHDQQLDYGHVLMDVNGDGELDHTRWAGAADGVLVWDKYQDGQVHDHTQYAFAQYGGKTDLEGLAAKFDTHRDGVFDALDELFAQFKVWRDANQNGVSDAGEVRSLSDWGLSAIDLVSDGIERQPVPGVHEAGRTFATGVNGRAVLVADAAFEYVRASELDDYRVMA